MERGILKYFVRQSDTAETRSNIASEFRRRDPWDIGASLGHFARTFGARAPLNWVAHQLFSDCVCAKIMHDDVVKLYYMREHTEIVDFQYFCDLEDGIDTALCDWWLADLDFAHIYEAFKEWRAMTEDDMAWDLIECWEVWHIANDGATKELSPQEMLSYAKAKNRLLEKKSAEIEAEAVKIGL